MKGDSSVHHGKVDDLPAVPDEGGAVSFTAEGGSQAGPVPDEGRLLSDLSQAEWLGGLRAAGTRPK